MGLKDFYYSLEDRWFDLLDWLEDRRIPAYAAVDPLEKRGIPSLPTYAALVVIVAWLLLGGVQLPAISGPGEKQVFLDLRDQTGACVEDASVRVLKDGSLVAEATTLPACTTKLLLAAGSYAVQASKQGCGSISSSISVTSDGTVTLPAMNCVVELAGEKQICTFPEGLENIVVVGRDATGIPQTSAECLQGICNLTVQSGWSYYFKAEGYESDAYRASTLEQLRQEDCVSLTEVVQPDSAPKGTVVVSLVDENNASVKWYPVRIVNPEDNSTDVVTPATTDGSGSAVFKAAVGTKFRVFVPASSTNTSLAAFLSNDSYEFANTTVHVRVVLKLAVATQVIVKEGAAVVPGVLVKIFDGTARISDGDTDADGVFEFGAVKDKTYLATFFRAGFAYSEANITGGRENTVQVSKIGQAETGWVDARTINKVDKTPFPGVTVSLYSLPEGGTAKETGYPDVVTDGLGKTRFDWVLPGSYCVSAKTSWGKPTACSEHAFTIEKGKGSLPQIIEVEPPTFIITVNVTTPAGGAAQGAEVRVYDYGGAEVDKKTADVEGLAFFELQKMLSASIVVDYSAGGEAYRAYESIVIDADKTVSVKLVKLDTKIQLTGIFDSQTGKPAVEPLSAGQNYYFKLGLGLPNISGKRWDTVEASLSLEKGFTEFPADLDMVLRNQYPDLNFDVTLGGEAMSATITISGKYEPTGATINLDVPFKVAAVQGEQLEEFKYSAAWTQESFSKQDAGSRIFEVTESANSDDGKLKIEKLIYKGTTSYSLDPSLVFDQSDLLTLWMKVTNKQPTFSGTIIFEAVSGEVAFQTPKITPAVGYGVVTNDGKAVQITISTIGKDDSFTIEVPALLVFPSTAIITTTVNGEEKMPPYQFAVQGNLPSSVEVTPTTIHEFTPNAQLLFKDKTTGVEIPWTKITEIRVDGTALVPDSCNYLPGGPGPNLVKPTYTSNAFSIDFTKDCPLNSRMGSFNITAKAAEYKIDDYEKGYSSCYTHTGEVAPQAEPFVETDLSLMIYKDACTDADLKFKDLNLATSCMGAACVFKNGDKKFSDFPNNIISSPTVEEDKLPLSFEYGALLDEEVSHKVVFEYVAYAETQTGEKIERTYESYRGLLLKPSSVEACLDLDASLFSGTRSVTAEIDTIDLSVKVGKKQTAECLDETKDISITVHDAKLTNTCGTGGNTGSAPSCAFTNAGQTTTGSNSLTLTTDETGIPLSFKYTRTPSKDVIFDATLTHIVTIEAYGGKVKIEKPFTHAAQIKVLPGSTGQYAGNYFKPLPIQRYGMPLDCENNWCSIDQALHYISQVRVVPVACMIPQTTQEVTVENLHLVDMGSATSSATVYDIVAAARDTYGSEFNSYTAGIGSGWSGKRLVVSQEPLPTGFMSKTAQFGIFSLKVKKSSTADNNCYTEFSFERQAATGPTGIDAVQLLIPTTTVGTQVDKFATYYSADTALKDVIDTQWKESTATETLYYSGGGHKLVKDAAGTSPRIEYDVNKKELKFVERTPALLSVLIDNFKAYVNPTDQNFAKDVFVINKSATPHYLTYGDKIFYFNTSVLGITNAGITTPLTKLVIKQLSIDESITIDADDGPRTAAYGVLVFLDDQQQPIVTEADGQTNTEDYEALFHTDRLFGPYLNIPDKAIITAAFMPSYQLWFFGKQGRADALLKKLADEPISGNYYKASADTAFEYAEKSVIDLKKDVKGPDFSTIVHTTGDCKLTDLSVSGQVKDKDGNSAAIYPNNYYLVTKKTDGNGNPVVYAHALTKEDKSTTTPCPAPTKPITRAIALYSWNADTNPNENYAYKRFTSLGSSPSLSEKTEFAEVHSVFGGAISGTAYDTDGDGKDDEIFVLYAVDADYEHGSAPSEYYMGVYSLDGNGLINKPGKQASLSYDKNFRGSAATAAYDSDGDGGKDKVFVAWSYINANDEYRIGYLVYNIKRSHELDSLHIDQQGDVSGYCCGMGAVSAVAYDTNGDEVDDEIFLAYAHDADTVGSTEYKYAILGITNGLPTLSPAESMKAVDWDHNDGSAISATAIDVDGNGVKDKILVWYSLDADATSPDNYLYSSYDIHAHTISDYTQPQLVVCCTYGGAISTIAYDTDGDKIEDKLLVAYSPDSDTPTVGGFVNQPNGYVYKVYSINDTTLTELVGETEIDYKNGGDKFLHGAAVSLVPLHG